jgi:hypothetical protein
VLSFFSSRRNWDSPSPSPAGKCAPPPPHGSGGRGTLAGERGVGRVPIPTWGHTLWYSLYIHTLCVTPLEAEAYDTWTDCDTIQMGVVRGCPFSCTGPARYVLVRVQYKWEAAGWGNGICLYLDWNALMTPQKATLETACVHFLDSYPIDVTHLTLIKKENEIFLIYKEIRSGAVAKS